MARNAGKGTGKSAQKSKASAAKGQGRTRSSSAAGRKNGSARSANGAANGANRSNGSNKIGFALVGLGHIMQSQVLPAFENAPNARIAALVSGHERKRNRLGALYGVPSRYSYEKFAECLASDEVDAVYIGLPNDMHERYVLAAAKAGVHVLCEKPLSLSERSCRKMIEACDEAGVLLMSAYRLHFEPANLRAMELIRRRRIGNPRFFNSSFGFQVKKDNIRVSAERGGGPVWDIGVYCINAARYLFRSEPYEVFATGVRGSDPRFSEVDETVSVIMRFPEDRTASFTCSFGTAHTANYRVLGTTGEIVLENAYEFFGERRLLLNKKGETSEEHFPEVDQFGPELIYFAECVSQGVRPEPDGWEGLADVRIVNAIHKSIKTGRVVKLEPVPELERRRGPSTRQMYRLPVTEEKGMVGVSAPSQ